MTPDTTLVIGILTSIEDQDLGHGCMYSDIKHYLQEKGYKDGEDNLYNHLKYLGDRGYIVFDESRVAGGRFQLNHSVRMLDSGHQLLDDLRSGLPPKNPIGFQ